MEKNRTNDPRFKRAKCALLVKCKQRNALNKYEEPCPNKSQSDTNARRYKINTSIESKDERKQRLDRKAETERSRRRRAKRKTKARCILPPSCPNFGSNLKEMKMKDQQSDEWELFDVTEHILNLLDVKGVKQGQCTSR